MTRRKQSGANGRQSDLGRGPGDGASHGEGRNKADAQVPQSHPVLSLWASSPKLLFSLQEKPYRHGELRRRLQGVSQQMLTRTLHGLESSILIARNASTSKPLAVEYSLTQPGKTISAPLRGMCRWAGRYRLKVSADVRLKEI